MDYTYHRIRFLWARLPIDVIWATCDTVAKIHLALSDLPEDLDKTYERCLQRLEGVHKSRSLRVLRYVYGAKTPLTIDALGGALATKPDTGELDKDDIPYRRFIMQSGANLITLDQVDALVTPSHHSVRTFLEHSKTDILKDLKLPIRYDAQVDLGQLCVVHLLWHNTGATVEHQRGPVGGSRNKRVDLPPISQMKSWIPGYNRTIQRLANVSLLRQSTKSPPVIESKSTALNISMSPEVKAFYSYARTNWILLSHHFTTKAEVWEKYEALVLIDPRNSLQRVDRKHTKPVDFRIFPWNFDSPAPLSSKILGWAICNRHLPLLDLALSLPPDLTQPLDDYDGLLPLHLVAIQGDIEVFGKLNGRSTARPLDVCRKTGRTALHYAAERGNDQMVRQLLVTSRDSNLEAVEKRDHDFCTPLDLAIFSGSLTTILTMEEQCHFMLWEARNREELLHSLSARGSPPEVVSYLLGVVLTWSINNNDVDLVTSVVEAGISLDTILDSNHVMNDHEQIKSPAIFFTLEATTPEVASAFLENGANPNVEHHLKHWYDHEASGKLYPIDLILSRGWAPLASTVLPHVSNYRSLDERQFLFQVIGEDVRWMSILTIDWIITEVNCDSHTSCNFATQLEINQRFLYAEYRDNNRSHTLLVTMICPSKRRPDVEFKLMMGTNETSIHDWRVGPKTTVLDRPRPPTTAVRIESVLRDREKNISYNRNPYNIQLVCISFDGIRYSTDMASWEENKVNWR